eukprot:ANDGO_03680.mRNA.1 tRNA wybutosine-synthesizing protein 2/3/4
MNANRIVATRGVPPPSILGHTSHAHGNKSFFFGGWSLTDAVCLKEVYSFDLDSTKWTHHRGPLMNRTSSSAASSSSVAWMPGRYRHASAAVDTEVWLHGGSNFAPNTSKDAYQVARLDDLYVYDMNSAQFRQMRPQVATGSGGDPGPRSGHSLTFANDCLYMFGGWNGYHMLSDMYRLDPREVKWHRVRYAGQNSLLNRTTCVPTGRSRHSALHLNNELAVLFGYTGSETLRDAFIFDIRADSWRPYELKFFDNAAEDIQFFSRCSATVNVFQGALIVLGGYHREGAKQASILKDGAIIDVSGQTYPLDTKIVEEFGSRYGHSSTKVQQNKLLIYGGMSANLGHNLRKPVVIQYSSKVGKMYERLMIASNALHEVEDQGMAANLMRAPSFTNTSSVPKVPLDRKESALIVSQVNRNSLFDDLSSSRQNSSRASSRPGSASRPRSGTLRSPQPLAVPLGAASRPTTAGANMTSQFQLSVQRKQRLHSLLARPISALHGSNVRRHVLLERMAVMDEEEFDVPHRTNSRSRSVRPSTSASTSPTKARPESSLSFTGSRALTPIGRASRSTDRLSSALAIVESLSPPSMQSDSEDESFGSKYPVKVDSLRLNRSMSIDSSESDEERRMSLILAIDPSAQQKTAKDPFAEDDPFTKNFRILKARATLTMKRAFDQEVDVRKLIGQRRPRGTVEYTQISNTNWTLEPELPPDLDMVRKRDLFWQSVSKPSLGVSFVAEPHSARRKSVGFRDGSGDGNNAELSPVHQSGEQSNFELQRNDSMTSVGSLDPSGTVIMTFRSIGSSNNESEAASYKSSVRTSVTNRTNSQKMKAETPLFKRGLKHSRPTAGALIKSTLRKKEEAEVAREAAAMQEMLENLKEGGRSASPAPSAQVDANSPLNSDRSHSASPSKVSPSRSPNLSPSKKKKKKKKKEVFNPYKQMPWVTEDMKLIYMGIPLGSSGLVTTSYSGGVSSRGAVHLDGVDVPLSARSSGSDSNSVASGASEEDEDNYWDLFSMAIPMVEKEILANEVLKTLDATKLSTTLLDEIHKTQRASKVSSAEEVLRLCLFVIDKYDRKFTIQADYETKPEMKRHKQLLASVCRRVGFQIKELAVQHAEKRKGARRQAQARLASTAKLTQKKLSELSMQSPGESGSPFPPAEGFDLKPVTSFLMDIASRNQQQGSNTGFSASSPKIVRTPSFNSSSSS